MCCTEQVVFNNNMSFLMPTFNQFFFNIQRYRIAIFTIRINMDDGIIYIQITIIHTNNWNKYMDMDMEDNDVVVVIVHLSLSTVTRTSSGRRYVMVHPVIANQANACSKGYAIGQALVACREWRQDVGSGLA